MILLAAIIVLAEALPVPRPPNTNCPAGYSGNGGMCSPNSASSKAAVPKSGNACPSGWSSSGGYCVKN